MLAGGARRMGARLMAAEFQGPVELWVDRLLSAEGPAMDAEGRLYVADSREHTLWRVSRHGGCEPFVRLAAPNGTAVHWNGDCYVTDLFGCRIARVTPSRQVFTVVDEYEGGPLGSPNDLTFHPSGALYFTAPKGHYAQDPPPGRVYRLGPGGDVQLAADVAWPNGVNVNADGSVLYIADSHTGEALTYDIRADGTLANCGVLADLREGQDNWWAPDGMCLDIEGNLYVAVYGAYRVRRVTPEGEIDLDIPVGHEKPANCCFGGADNDELFITCREGALYRVKIGIPGLPLFGP